MKNKQEAKQEKNKNLIRMVRLDDVEPKTADVHPEMIQEYQKGGWIIQNENSAE